MGRQGTQCVLCIKRERKAYHMYNGRRKGRLRMWTGMGSKGYDSWRCDEDWDRRQSVTQMLKLRTGAMREQVKKICYQKVKETMKVQRPTFWLSTIPQEIISW